MAKSKYTLKDAAKDTGVSTKEASKAWHDAREHAQKAGELNERKITKERKKKHL